MTFQRVDTCFRAMDQAQKQRSKRLSWLLRHGATEAGLLMEPAGWVAVEHVLGHLAMDLADLESCVRENTKGRLELRDGRVRACQGHSVGVPVTCEALEASWRRHRGEKPIWHGTFLEAAEALGREGLRPQARTHVHLAPARDSVVGKRSRVHVALAIEPARVRAAGISIFEAPNGVLLARRVPAEAIVGFVCETRRAQREHDSLAVSLGVSCLSP